MKRMWINQPSKQQTAHKWHAVNVLAVDDGEGFSKVFFLSGEVESARLPTPCLSNGWIGRVPVDSEPRNVVVEHDRLASPYARNVYTRGKSITLFELDRLQGKIVDAQRLSTPDSPVGKILFR